MQPDNFISPAHETHVHIYPLSLLKMPSVKYLEQECKHMICGFLSLINISVADMTNQSQKTFPVKCMQPQNPFHRISHSHYKSLEVASKVPHLYPWCNSSHSLHDCSPETSSLSNKHLFSPYCVPGHGVIQINKLWLCPSGVLQGSINNYCTEIMNCYRGALKTWRKRRVFFICSLYLECLE